MSLDQLLPAGEGAVATAPWPPPEPVITFTDAELTFLALAADPEAPLPPDAVPFASVVDTDDAGPGLLPEWYMPRPASFARSNPRRAIVALVVLCLVVVNAVGLCVTSGRLSVAW